MSRTVIGILAGMGPRTTSPFLEAVLDRCRQWYGATWDEDYPDIVIYSLPAPFRPDRPIDTTGMQAALKRGAAALARAGAHVIAVPCNIAHLYFPAICEGAGVEVLHIVEETLKRLPATPTGATAVLATRALAESRLYHDILAQRGLVLVSDSGLQARIDALILAFKAEGASPATVAQWHALESWLQGLGATDAVLACTDLAFCAAHQLKGGLQVFDSAAILADATVAEFCCREGIVPHKTRFIPK
jgi:aspartate racemase